MSATSASATPPALPFSGVRSRRELWAVYRVERRKLFSQVSTRLLVLVCVVAPFVFAGVLKVQSGSPTDTLYGVWVHSSGFALSLVLLAFAGSWGFPLAAGVIAGDVFSSEDRYGTWKMVLTRSCTRAELFGGKLLATTTFTIGLVVLTAASSLVAGLLLIGGGSLVSLSGTVIPAGKALALVAVSWLLCLLPTLAFMSLAVLVSTATRNGIIGVISPALAALAMQLLLLVGSGVWVHMLLVSSAFITWQALFSGHIFYGPLLVGILVSLAWTAVCLSASWAILRKRDFAGTPVTRRPGWVAPTRSVVILAGVIALVAIAANWGPVGITAARLQASLTPAFNNLTLLQQRELGRPVAPGARLNILPSCSRRGSVPRGPGDWVCTMNVVTPSPGPVPIQQTPVTYDVSVQSDGCYKAQSPPTFIGQQLMRDDTGHDVVNPLYTIYGCFDTL